MLIHVDDDEVMKGEMEMNSSQAEQKLRRIALLVFMLNKRQPSNMSLIHM